MYYPGSAPKAYCGSISKIPSTLINLRFDTLQETPKVHLDRFFQELPNKGLGYVALSRTFDTVLLRKVRYLKN